MRKQKGFSLIELLIVVAIILIIAAIAVPNLLRSRMAANEASAAGALRSVGTANVSYSATYNVGFSPDLSSLGPPAAGPGTAASSSSADLLDAVLSGVNPSAVSPTKSGYVFTYLPGTAAPTIAAPNGTFSVAATPITAASTGQSTFCNDQTNVVIKDTDGISVAGGTLGCPDGDFVVNGTTINPL